MSSPTTKRILICDDLHASALEVFQAHGFEPEVATGLDEAALVERVPGVHALVVRSATRITLLPRRDSAVLSGSGIISLGRVANKGSDLAIDYIVES